MLILIVLAAIIVVWNVVNRVVKTGAEGIGTEAFTVNLEITEAKVFVTGGAQIKVKRGAGKGEITSLKFIFYDEKGESVIVEEDGTKGYCSVPEELETKICEFDASDVNINVAKVSVVPMFGKKPGMEVLENKPNTGAAPTGLVSWWKFDGDFRDSVGGNHGTAYGGAKIENNVAVFDGVDDYVNVGEFFWDTILDGQQPLSVTFWAKGNVDLSAATKGILSKGTDPTMTAMTIGEEHLHFLVKAGSTTKELAVKTTAFNYLQNTWQYWGMIYDGSGDASGVKLFLNGISQDLTVLSDNLGSNIMSNDVDMKIGDGYASNQDWNGTIDDVMIFNKALNEDEIKALYNNQKK